MFTRAISYIIKKGWWGMKNENDSVEKMQPGGGEAAAAVVFNDNNDLAARLSFNPEAMDYELHDSDDTHFKIENTADYYNTAEDNEYADDGLVAVCVTMPGVRCCGEYKPDIVYRVKKKRLSGCAQQRVLKLLMSDLI
jgi:hypothetical protein